MTASQPGPVAAELDVSIVIPTYRRDDLLQRCIEALAHQRFDRSRLEVIVVDDARSPSLPPLIAALQARHPDIELHLLPGRSQGPAVARNIGWRAARGRVVAFIDDDAYPASQGWLAIGLSPFQDEDVDAVSGAVIVPADDPPTDFQRNVKGWSRASS
jgi:glycosyltransferase involved in cell wall biosynthesis